MRLARILLGIVAVVATLAAVADAAHARSLPALGPVEAIGTAGAEVAYADRYRGDCHEARVWSTADRGNRRYASHCWESTSTGSGVASIAVAGGRALWLTYVGGNIREYTLWTKTRSTSARRLRFEARDVDAAAPIVVGAAWESLLPYAVERTIVALRPNGSRAFAYEAPDEVRALAAHNGGVAAVLANGHVLALSPAGRLVRDYAYAPGDAQAAVFAGTGAVVVATKTGLDVRLGAALEQHALPRGFRFLGYSEGVAAYALGAQLRLYSLPQRRSVLYRTLTQRFPAQLGRRGLAYANGRVVSFDAWSTVAAALR